MSVYERRQKIMEHLHKERFSTVKKLSLAVWSSESSVRRDLKELERGGLVRQVYGGVTLPEYEHSVIPVEVRDSSNSPIKDTLAKRAAEELFDGATVILDGSSTVRRIMKYTDKFHSLKIITNNLRVFEDYRGDATLICTGGVFVKNGNIFVGRAAEEFIKGINADILFFSSQALSLDGEISDASEEETSLRRVMLSRAKKTVFLCDSSKLGARRTYRLCSLDEVDEVICDKEIKG